MQVLLLWVLAHIKTAKAEICGSSEHARAAQTVKLPAQQSLERAARLCRALGELSRFRLLARLSAGEMCVTEIAQAEGEELSAISQRLRVLRAENVVVRRRRGKHINYALADQHIARLVADLLEHASEPVRVEIED